MVSDHVGQVDSARRTKTTKPHDHWAAAAIIVSLDSAYSGSGGSNSVQERARSASVTAYRAPDRHRQAQLGRAAINRGKAGHAHRRQGPSAEQNALRMRTPGDALRMRA